MLPVSGDITYEAVYSREPIVREDVGGIKLSPTLKKLFIAGIASLSVIILGVVTLVVVAVVRKRKGINRIKRRRGIS
jgi:hypothetical protein